MYRNTGKTHDKPILWGAPCSFYSGKTRSYFIKKGIAYQELFGSHPRYEQEILPLIGYLVVPVVELTDGTLIQDTTDTIVHLEEKVPEPALIPKTPVQKAVAWLIGFFGSEALLKPGMHYRWSYLDEQRPFLEAAFGRALSGHRDMKRQREQVAPVMEYFGGFLKNLGVTPQTIPVIEASYKDLLDLLNDHFLHYPYILGGRPSLADFGLVAPLFAHLARDPYPSMLMKNRAPHVFRWTERMNQAGFTDGEFPDLAPDFLPKDELPETLEPILRYFFTDCGPEVMGMIACYNAWIETHPALPSGAVIQGDHEAPTAHPSLGWFDFELRGVPIHRRDYVDAVYHFQRVLDVVAGLDGEGREGLGEIVDRAGGRELLAARPVRRIKSENYKFVLE
jgi:glutathione S-transferase